MDELQKQLLEAKAEKAFWMERYESAWFFDSYESAQYRKYTAKVKYLEELITSKRVDL